MRSALVFSGIFITHDLSLLVEISDAPAITYAGRIVEYGPIARMGGTERRAPGSRRPEKFRR